MILLSVASARDREDFFIASFNADGFRLPSKLRAEKELEPPALRSHAFALGAIRNDFPSRASPDSRDDRSLVALAQKKRDALFSLNRIERAFRAPLDVFNFFRNGCRRFVAARCL